MCHGAAAERRAAEARLHRVAIGDAQHPDNDAARTLFAALHFELTTFERELYMHAVRERQFRLRLISGEETSSSRVWYGRKRGTKERARPEMLAESKQMTTKQTSAHLIAPTLSAIFLCSINGNTCSVSFLSGSRLFSQP